MESIKFNLKNYLVSLTDKELRNLYIGATNGEDTPERRENYINFINIANKYYEATTIGLSISQSKINTFKEICNECIVRFINFIE